MLAGVQVNPSSMLHLKTGKFGKNRRTMDMEKYHQEPRGLTGHPKCVSENAVSVSLQFLQHASENNNHLI